METLLDDHLGSRIRKIRKARGLTQEELARASELSNGFISELEQGNRSVSASNLLKIAKVLGTTIDYLLSVEEPTDAFDSGGAFIPPELGRVALKMKLTYAQTRDALRQHHAMMFATANPRRRYDAKYWKRLCEELRATWKT